MKTLYFEGVGWADADWSKATDVGNCRVKTAFTNDKGEQMYIDISCSKVDEYIAPSLKNMTYAGCVDDCFYFAKENDRYTKRHMVIGGTVFFEYNKENILRYVNSHNCSFDEIVVLPRTAGYHVYREKGGYNLSEDFSL